MTFRTLLVVTLSVSIGGLLSPSSVSIQDSAADVPVKRLTLLQDDDQGPLFLSCDAAISVDVRPVRREGFSSQVEVGLVFGVPEDKSQRSLFGVRPQEETYRIGVYRSGPVTDFVAPTSSEAVQSKGFNRLRVRTEDKTPRFFVNGEEVFGIGGMRTQGFMGVYLAGFGVPNIGGRYDNFEVKPLDSGVNEDCPRIKDDFSNPDSGWADQQSGPVTWTYTDDAEYEMRKVTQPSAVDTTTNVQEPIVEFTDFLWSPVPSLSLPSMIKVDIDSDGEDEEVFLRPGFNIGDFGAVDQDQDGDMDTVDVGSSNQGGLRKEDSDGDGEMEAVVVDPNVKDKQTADVDNDGDPDVIWQPKP